MARPGIFKSIKEWGKKAASKAGKFVEKISKGIRQFQPVVDKITDFIPGGEEIDKYLNMGLDIADKVGEGLQEVGEGKNVFKTAAEKALEYLNMPKKPTNNKQLKNDAVPVDKFTQEMRSNKPKVPFLNNKLN